MKQSIIHEPKTLLIISHHLSAPQIILPVNPKINYVRTLRLDPKEAISKLHTKLHFLVVKPPQRLKFPSVAFSDSITFFNADSLVSDHDYVGVFQYRRILGLRCKSKRPVIHRYRIQSPTLLRELERLLLSGQHKYVYVAHPLRVMSLEEQYSHNHAATLPLMKQLRSLFRINLEKDHWDTNQIDPELFYWSSLYLGPREHLLEFQDLLLRTFEKFDASAVPSRMTPYESRWVGFIVERLFSDYIQCLIAAKPGLIRTVPVLQLNPLPGLSRIKQLITFDL